MTTQEAISDFRRGERVQETRVYKCVECGHVSTTGGLDMSPVEVQYGFGGDCCNDEIACNRRVSDFFKLDIEQMNRMPRDN